MAHTFPVIMRELGMGPRGLLGTACINFEIDLNFTLLLAPSLETEFARALTQCEEFKLG